MLRECCLSDTECEGTGMHCSPHTLQCTRGRRTAQCTTRLVPVSAPGGSFTNGATGDCCSTHAQCAGSLKCLFPQRQCGSGYPNSALQYPNQFDATITVGWNTPLPNVGGEIGVTPVPNKADDGVSMNCVSNGVNADTFTVGNNLNGTAAVGDCCDEHSDCASNYCETWGTKACAIRNLTAVGADAHREVMNATNPLGLGLAKCVNSGSDGACDEIRTARVGSDGCGSTITVGVLEENGKKRCTNNCYAADKQYAFNIEGPMLVRLLYMDIFS